MLFIVDVRLPSEWMAFKIGTVLNLPLNQLSELSGKLDMDVSKIREVFVIQIQ